MPSACRRSRGGANKECTELKAHVFIPSGTRMQHSAALVLSIVWPPREHSASHSSPLNVPAPRPPTADCPPSCMPARPHAHRHSGEVEVLALAVHHHVGRGDSHKLLHGRKRSGLGPHVPNPRACCTAATTQLPRLGTSVRSNRSSRAAAGEAMRLRQLLQSCPPFPRET